MYENHLYYKKKLKSTVNFLIHVHVDLFKNYLFKKSCFFLNFRKTHRKTVSAVICKNNNQDSLSFQTCAAENLKAFLKRAGILA